MDMMQSPLPRPLFKTIVEHTPLVSIDLIVRDAQGHMLLGLRRNRPARDWWFVPGGRILKGETLDHAFLRVTRSELGLPRDRSNARFLGAFEHFYDDNFSGEVGFGTHYVVLGFELAIEPAQLALPGDQHDGYRWLSDAEVVSALDVHENTKAYARPG